MILENQSALPKQRSDPDDLNRVNTEVCGFGLSSLQANESYKTSLHLRENHLRGKTKLDISTHPLHGTTTPYEQIIIQVSEISMGWRLGASTASWTVFAELIIFCGTFTSLGI